MKSTGYVRRFDDLGRIVIPKEVRAQINNGNKDMESVQMEIFIGEDNSVILKRYEPLE